MVELQSVVAESRAAQLAFGAMGECFPVFDLMVFSVSSYFFMNDT